MDFGARLDKNNMNFKHLYEVFRDDLKFKKYERKLITLIQGDWKVGEHDEK